LLSIVADPQIHTTRILLPFHKAPTCCCKLSKLRVQGEGETAEVKQQIQALLREIAIVQDGGCILPHYTGSGACGGYRRDAQLILQAEHLVTRANSVSYADLRAARREGRRSNRTRR
jgi:hypothetical protein